MADTGRIHGESLHYRCYYDDPLRCHEELWQCETCGQLYCKGIHSHQTTLGRNVECVTCERTRVGLPLLNSETGDWEDKHGK